MNRKIFKIPLIIFIFSILFIVSCGYSQKNIKMLSVNTEVEKDKTDLESAVHFQNLLRNISKSLKPAVVNIQVVTKPRPTSSIMGGDKMMDELLKRFFGQGMGGNGSAPEENNGGTAVGSGFIISSDGYIVTNAHVASNAKSITVVLEDRTNLEAELIGLDTKTDIALLKVKASKPLTAAPLGNSDDIDAGDFAVAIGNPFGLTGTLTFGIISAKGRNSFIEENAAYKNYIQTDVSINPGNSGGPLINIYGQVIGLNSAIYSTSGGSIGIGFSIPINIVKNVVNQLLQSGHVTRGTIGVMIGPVSKDMAAAAKLKNTQGVLVNDVMEGTPAQKAGLQVWDIVKSVNKKNVEDPSDFLSKISALAPGQKVELGIIRDGKPQTITITISSKDFTKGNSASIKQDNTNTKDQESSWDWQGMTLMDVSTAKQTIMGVPANMSDGVLVTAVEDSSKAAQQGVAPGDILLNINKKNIRSLAELKSVASKNKVFYLQFKSARMGRNLLVVLP